MNLARRKKPGPRTKSGRLSRAHKRNPELRDMGTREAQHKRRLLVGADGDESLAETVLGSLLAHGYIDREQYDEGLHFRYLYVTVFGLTWPRATMLDLPTGRDLPESRFADLEARMRDRLAVLTREQERAVVDIAGHDIRPHWLITEKVLNREPIPEDDAQKAALISGLTVLVERRKTRRAA